MSSGPQNLEELEERQLRKLLAATVRSIQWSYAIFWSVSPGQQGVLAWNDGFYNGDIKTRKTTQPMEFKVDKKGLLRSEQLRDLYESLSSGDSFQQLRRPSASLSPEDLTDTEWYYLVCMSFTFSPGQGLPGKALANSQHVWLSNAQFADNKIFSRSLLAKSASIQTVVCLPFMDGVLELGTTDLVLEDATLINHVATSFWEVPYPVCSEQSISNLQMGEHDEDVMVNIDQDLFNTVIMDNQVARVQAPLEGNPPVFRFTLDSYAANKVTELVQDKVEEVHANTIDELQKASSHNSSNEFCLNRLTGDSHKMDGLNSSSQVHSKQLMDDEFSNCLHDSLNSSDCISQCLSNPSRILSSPKGEKVTSHTLDCQEVNSAKFVSLNFGNGDSHYTRTLSAILRNSKQLIPMACFPKNSNKSSFRVWGRVLNAPIHTPSMSQRLLKKILVDFSSMHDGEPLKLQKDFGIKSTVWRTRGDDASASHVISERRRREKLNVKFLQLRSLIPSISKVDEASILFDTIEYLKELERRLEGLESCKELEELRARERRNLSDIEERTSDNYGNNENSNGRKPSVNKRRASSVDEAEIEDCWESSKDSAADVSVRMLEKEVFIELHCRWREFLLLEIVDAINNLHLDAYSLQSSTTDGILALAMKAKFKGSVISSPGMIKRALQSVVGKC